MKLQNNIIFLAIVYVIAGCKLPNDKTIDTAIPPTLIETSISPNNIDFGKIVFTSSSVEILLTGYAMVSDDNGLDEIANVGYKILSPDGTILATGSLTDDGNSPDQIAHDGKYTSLIKINFPKDIIGTYVFQIQAIDKQNLKSNTISQSINIVRSTNAIPSLSQLSAPDTVFVPTDNSFSIVKVSVTASDPDGLSDITTVYLTSQRPDSSIAGNFSLYDDGGKNIIPIFAPFGLTSGDSVANDGRFTLQIPITKTTDRNTYRDFVFVARDQSGAFSPVITKRIFVK